MQNQRSTKLGGRTFGLTIGSLMLAVSAGFAVDLGASPLAFRSNAVVMVTAESDALSRVTLTQTALAAIVSKPVLQRAAAVLKDMPVPPPDLVERLAGAVSMAGTRVTGRDARLAQALAPIAYGSAGDLPGTINLFASGTNGDNAARIANAIVRAFIDEEDDQANRIRLQNETALDGRLATLKAAANAAHARFASLGGMANPVGGAPAARSQLEAAQARLDAVRSIIASGTPPLSDRKDLPDSIISFQTTYLDLTAQLLKARQTLGDRHTTILSLKDGVRRAAIDLTAEWKRVEKIARTELDDARDRERAATKQPASGDDAHAALLDEARLSVLEADTRLARLEASRSYDLGEERPYRLLSPAAAPVDTVGFSQEARSLLGTLAAVFFLVLLRLGQRRSRDRMSAAKTQEATPKDVLIPKVSKHHAGLLIEKTRPIPHRSMRRHNIRVLEPTIAHPIAEPIKENRYRSATPSLLSALELVDPQYGVSTVTVASNETDADTPMVASGLAAAIAESGRRVLLVESFRRDPTLAALADPKAEPKLVDLFGTLRIMLRAEVGKGFCYVAPLLHDGGRITSSLTRRGDVPIIDDVAGEFDLVIFDRGRIQTPDIATDLYIRVGRFTSQRADRQFLAACDAPADRLIGTIIDHVFVTRDMEASTLSVEDEVAEPIRSKIPVTILAHARQGGKREGSVARRRIGVR